jgi:hypothetical protein
MNADAVDKKLANLLEGGRKAAQLLQEVLPIPALWYGINYV